MLDAEASEHYMCDNFNYVELDIKLEQSIQRASKSQTLMFAVVAEFELISHEILIIQNNCRKLADEVMDVFENGEKIQTRDLVLKTKKFAVTIHRCNLPKCDTVGNRHQI